MNERLSIIAIAFGAITSFLLILLLFSNDWTYARYNRLLESVDAVAREQHELREGIAQLERRLAVNPSVNVASPAVTGIDAKHSRPISAGVEVLNNDYELNYVPAPKGGIYREATTADPESLNPITSNDAFASQIEGMVLNSLISYHPESLIPIPELAASWQISEDKLRVRFRLRSGVVWSDGQPLSTEDVLFSFRVIKNARVNAPPLQSYYSDLQEVRVLSENEIEVIWAKPYFKMLSIAGGKTILPAHYYRKKYGVADESSPEFADHFNKDRELPEVTTGNYLFKAWETGKSIRLVRNPRSWQQGLGNFDEILYLVISDRTAQMQQLKNLALDSMSLEVQEYIDEGNNPIISKNYDIHQYPSPSYTYIGYNMRQPQLQDKRVRRALTHLMDRSSVVSEVLHGQGNIITGPFSLGTDFNDTGIEPYAFDKKRALELLGEAGWKSRGEDGLLADGSGNTLKIHIVTNQNNREREVAVRTFTDNLKSVGIDASYQYLNWSVLIEKLNKRQYDALVLGWSTELLDPDPYQLWHSSQAMDDGSNHVGFKHAEVDALIESIRTNFNREERVRDCKRIHAILHEEQPYTFLWSRKSFLAVSKKIKNKKIYPGGMSVLEWHY